MDMFLALCGWITLALPCGIALASFSRKNSPKHTLTMEWLYVPLGLAWSTIIAIVCARISLTAAILATGFSSLLGLYFLITASTWSKVNLKSPLLILVVVITFIKMLPYIWFSEARGFDPYFHMLLSDQIVTSNGMISSWLPYEDIASIHYPLGAHVLMAIIARVTQVPTHTIFLVGTVLAVSLLTFQVFALVKYSFKSKDGLPDETLAFWAAAIFLLLPGLGSFDYPLWGGLPNAIALTLLLSTFAFLARDGQGISFKRHTCLLASLGLGLSLLHHHVMLTAIILMLVELCFSFSKKDRRQRILAALGATAVLGSWYFVPYALNIMQIGQTSVFDYKEPFLSPAKISEDLGLSFTALIALGCLFAVAAMRTSWSNFFSSGNLRTPFMRALVTLLILFFALEYILRSISPGLFGREIVAFTPSRFLTDAVPFLAVLAAYACIRMQRWRNWPCAGIFTFIVGMGFISQGPKYFDLWRFELKDDHRKAYEFIRLQTPENAFVIDQLAAASYYTRRASFYTPVPSSEEFGAVTARMKRVKSFIAGEPWPEIWKGRPILCVATAEEMASLPRPSILLWESGNGLNVYQFPES